MKKKVFLWTLLVISSILYSCDKDDSDFEYEEEFKKSHNTWVNFKSQSNDSYEYMVQTFSFLGIATETTIIVKNGEVIQRSYKREEHREELITIAEEWIEKKDEIGNHKNSGAQALSLDQIYEKARIDWLLKRKDAITHFETNNNGMISRCGYISHGCMDDCFTGIYIKQIKALK